MKNSEKRKFRPHVGRLLLGICSFILGLLIVPLPIPLGWFFLLVGISLVAVEIAWVGHSVRWFRSRWDWGDRRLRQLHPISPALVKEFLDNTDPHI